MSHLILAPTAGTTAEQQQFASDCFLHSSAGHATQQRVSQHYYNRVGHLKARVDRRDVKTECTSRQEHLPRSRPLCAAVRTTIVRQRGPNARRCNRSFACSPNHRNTTQQYYGCTNAPDFCVAIYLSGQRPRCRRLGCGRGCVKSLCFVTAETVIYKVILFTLVAARARRRPSPPWQTRGSKNG